MKGLALSTFVEFTLRDEGLSVNHVVSEANLSAKGGVNPKSIFIYSIGHRV